MKMICRHSPQMNGLEGSLSQGMSFLKLHPSYPQISSLPVSTLPHHHAFSSTFPPSIPPRKPCLRNPRISDSETPVSDKYPETLVSTGFEDLATDGAVYQNTLRLVECSMFAAVAGLAYFLSNSLAIENYFGCFFSLPIVISSMRWGVSAGGYCYATAYFVWSSKGVYISAYARISWSGHGLFVEVGGKLGSFNCLVHICSCNGCDGVCSNNLILNKRKYPSPDHHKYPCFCFLHSRSYRN
ncbi:uncharacterized protein LOC143879291 isoform X8 [Tasmannia lanceolata]|uniref:uncharacterized protein LOC143879291 isoform X8 n=1 Tax=Tasmannia lanceolata TaxID=3420 RepID=UPI00406367B0